MAFPDEFARRLGPSTSPRQTSEGEDQNKPLLFRGGDIRGGGDAPASLASANGDCADGSGMEPQQRRSDERNHPNPSFEKEGLSDPNRPEPVEGQPSLDTGPSTSSGRTDGDKAEPTLCSPASPTRAIRHDGWHPELRVKFLEALARTGNVGAASYFVQRSRQSAYDLKRRDTDFARGWLAALVLAREEAQDKLQERAIEGVEEEIFYHGEVVATRRRYDARLLLAHLARLDKIAAQIPAQRGAARFGEMLAAIGAGEDTAPLIATPTADELAELTAESGAEAAAPAGPAEPEPVPEEETRAEFYAIRWPDDDGPPEYYRMSPDEAAEMERDVPGLTATATGSADNAVITAIVDPAELGAAMTKCGSRWAENGKNL